MSNNNSSTTDIAVEEKLRALYELQVVDSEIDKIKILRGELPLEVRDLEDEIEGLHTRINNFLSEMKSLDQEVNARRNEIKDAKNLIDKYTAQQQKVRNNREFESLNKEIEYQHLEIELAEKRIREHNDHKKQRERDITYANQALEDRQKDLDHKRAELDAIIAETQKDEAELQNKSGSIRQIIEPRLLNAYTRIRKNVRNGLAVASIVREACGGCFNRIPPQRQLDIRSRKKIIVCEHCGRILVDNEINQLV